MRTTAAVLALALAAGGAAAQCNTPMKVGEVRRAADCPSIRLIATDVAVTGTVGYERVFITTVGNVTLGRVGDTTISVVDFRTVEQPAPAVVAPTTVIGSHQWAMDYLMKPVGDD